MRWVAPLVIACVCAFACGRRHSSNVVIASERVWVQEGDYSYHRRDCKLLTDPATSISKDVMLSRIATAKPYRPCGTCKP